MRFRQPTLKEIPWLIQKMHEGGFELINLWSSPCWVCERDGRIVGILPIRLMWQFEPLYVLPEVKGSRTRARICYGLYKAAEGWVSDRKRNNTGVYMAFAITRLFAVRGWAKKMGWLHQYKRAPLFIKHF